MPLSLPRLRWLILAALVGLLLIAAPKPTDTAALSAFQWAAELPVRDTPGQDVGKPALQATWFACPDGRCPGNYQDIEAAYQGVIARRPRDPQPWRQLGDLYTIWGRPDDALHAYNQALLRGDDSAALDRSLAHGYTILGNLQNSCSSGPCQASMRYWTAYLARRPDDRAARQALGRVAIRLADWERARIELEHLLADDPTDVVAHAWLGLLLIGPDPLAGASHLQQAASDSALAAQLAPIFIAERLSLSSDDPAYRSALLGMSLLNLDVSVFGRLERESGQLSPVNQEDLQQAITTLALRSLLAAIYRSPGYADAYAYLGQAFEQLGQSDWAQAALRYALELAPGSALVQTMVGLYWDRHQSPALARQYFEAAYNQDPDNATLCLEIAATYLDEGNYTAAEIWLRFATEIAPDDPQVWKTLAQFYIDLGIDVEASGLPAARRLLELVPRDARAHDLLGWAQFLADEQSEALDSLLRALALDPTLASAHYHLGRLHALQGDYAQAVRAYQQAAANDVRGQLAPELDRAWDDLPEPYRVNALPAEGMREEQ
jgi:tetratricopeptide (TPR) repeat protein